MKAILLVIALLATSSFAFVSDAEAGNRRGRRCAPYYGGYGYSRNVVVVNRGYRPYYRPYYYAPRPVMYAPACYAPTVYYGGPRFSFYAGF